MICRRRGVTITETMMAGAIGAAMLGLLLPAISAAIANSQGSRCRNNLARLAQGLSAYHDAQGHFPASVEGLGTYFASNGDPGNKNWVFRILPYIDEQALYDSFVFTPPGVRLASFNNSTQRPYNGTSLAAGDPIRGTTTPIADMLCSADSGAGVTFQMFIGNNQFNQQPSQFQQWARGNYGANACLSFPFQYLQSSQSIPIAPACGDITQPQWTGTRAWATRGVMGGNVGLSRSQITDGTSNTVLLGELRIGLNKADPRGVWALALGGASAAWHHGMMPPNDCYSGGDYLAAYAKAPLLLLGAAGTTTNEKLQLGHQAAALQCMQISGENDGSSGPAIAQFRSSHAGGVFVAMCDGSVRFISDSVDHGNLGGYWEFAPPWGFYDDAQLLQQFRTWERLNASGDGLVVNDSTDPNYSSTVVRFILGDMNGDGVMDNFDISAMELALVDPAAYLTAYPALADYQLRGDVNQDGLFNNFDILAFEQMLMGSD